MKLSHRISKFLFPALTQLDEDLKKEPLDPTTMFIMLPFHFMACCFAAATDFFRLFLLVAVPCATGTLTWWLLTR